MTKKTHRAVSNPSFSRASDPLAILREEAEAAALAHGADRCEELADSLVQRYLSRTGGAQFYVRQARGIAREKTYREIRARFNGLNLAELAKDFELSTRQVRRIVCQKVAQ